MWRYKGLIGRQQSPSIEKFDTHMVTEAYRHWEEARLVDGENGTKWIERNR